MNGSQDQQSWISNAILIGVLYCVIGILFAAPSTHVQGWRVAAWITSAIVYGIHIWYEYFRARNSVKATALHVAIAAGIGAFGLAMGAFVHSLVTPPDYSRLRFALAFVVWPLLTGLPAFVVGLVITLLLNLFRPNKATT
jgi:hypothetical protein